ncbi:MAG: hypothetical protein ACYSVY_18425 [Planctomycetota bacterium]|jgi:hypothetical protein
MMMSFKDSGDTDDPPYYYALDRMYNMRSLSGVEPATGRRSEWTLHL